MFGIAANGGRHGKMVLTEEGFHCQWFLFIQKSERFKIDKKLYKFDFGKTSKIRRLYNFQDL